MKRKLAILLAVVMVLTMMPFTAFAASNNAINRVPLVAENHKFTMDNAPILRIAEKDNTWQDLAGDVQAQTFRLVLENAEWLDIDEEDIDGVTITKLSKTTIQVVTSEDATTVLIPMFVKVLSGEAKVTVDPRDSAVTAGTYTFARTAKGNAVVSVDGTVTFGSGGTAQLKTIEIDETTIGAYNGTKKVRFALPADFRWNADEDAIEDLIDFAGGYTDKVAIVDVSIDKEILEVTFDIDDDASTRGTIYFEELPIRALTKAAFGDIHLRVSGSGLETARLHVAKYVDYAIVAEADDEDDIPELWAGRLNLEDLEDVHELQTLVIKEEVTGSWLRRNVKIEFPEWVKIIEIEYTGKGIVLTEDELVIDFDIDENVVEFVVDAVDTVKTELELTFAVSVKPNASGDIVANVSGRGIGAEFDVLLGKAIAAVTLETTLEEVVVGKQSQDIGEITLTETKAGALRRGKVVEVKLPTDFNWKSKPTITVDGDLKVKSIETDKNTLTFEIDRESTDEPAVIKITEGKVDLLRIPADGEYRVTVGGSALVENNESTIAKGLVDTYSEATTDADKKAAYDAILWDQNWVARDYVINVVPQASKPAVVFTMGSTTFTVGGVAQQADVAPVVKNNRTFVPIAWSAMALDVNYSWSGSTQTVTLFGDRIVQMTIGSKTMLVNGVPMQMDVAPYIENNRTFVPVAWAATALGVNYTWDNTAKAVTFY